MIINLHSPPEKKILFRQPSGKHCWAKFDVSKASRTARKHLLFIIIFPGMWCLRLWEWKLHTQTNEYQHPSASSLDCTKLAAAREASEASVNSFLEWLVDLNCRKSSHVAEGLFKFLNMTGQRKYFCWVCGLFKDKLRKMCIFLKSSLNKTLT